MNQNTYCDAKRATMQPTIFQTARLWLVAATFATCAVVSKADGPAGVDAATATAKSTANSCYRQQPFYWEIGDVDQTLASGSVGSPARISAKTLLTIASSSKWLYAAYVVERGFAENERQYFNLTSGYHGLGKCKNNATVQECFDKGRNGLFDASAVDKFYYDGAHMQKHAILIGLGGLNSQAFAAEINSRLGSSFSYDQAQPAGGARSTPAQYIAFLRRLMRGELALGARLGEAPICTDPTTCSTALYSPLPTQWSYSIGHWVESDGDGAYSSPGAFGFYPWISADKTRYGVVAANKELGSLASAQCGAAIRKAFLTGIVQ